MNSGVKSFFLFSSLALIFLFLISSVSAYSYFDLSVLLDSHQQSELFYGGVSVLIILLLILFLLAKKFLLPILSLQELVTCQRENREHHYKYHFNDELSQIGEHLQNLKQKLDEDDSSLEILTLNDPLTGLKNRRYLFEVGEEIFQISKRNKENLSVIILDIDHLNDINTKYGKKAGDNTLKSLTRATESCIRKSDVFVRYGEDQFIVLLPKTAKEDAQIVAHKIQSMLGTSSFKAKAETPFTLSMGISSREPTDTLLRTLVQRADKVLSGAKEHGTNHNSN